jgi:phosphoglycerate dehydrogenase-like enzyme
MMERGMTQNIAPTVESGKASRIVVISDSFHTLPEAVATLDQSGHHVTYVNALTSWTELASGNREALAEAEAVVTGRGPSIERADFELAPKLKVIALHTSGSDNIPIDEATRRGVLVTNVKGVNAEQCAEFAMGLMLCVVRQILTGDRAIRAGQWASRTQSSIDVNGATVAVIGLGLIAKAFVRRAKAFGMRVLIHTRTQDAALASELGFEYASLGEALRSADIVCLFASLSDETRGMIGARELALMKPSAYFINIARGELVDQNALLDALRNRKIAGAGLDVFEVEPLYESPFFELDNVVLTPHQAGLTNGGKSGAAVRAARNALSVLRGIVPKDAVNPAAWNAHRTASS